MEERAYNQANTREPIQVIGTDGWRSSIRHYKDVGESFDSTQERQDMNSEEMFTNEMRTRHSSEDHAKTHRKRSLSICSSDESVEVNRIHISNPIHDSMGPMHTFYKDGKSSRELKDQSYPFEDIRPRSHSPNRSLYAYTDETLVFSNNFEEDARLLLQAPLTSQRRIRNRRKERSRSGIGMNTVFEEGEIESDEEINIDSDKTTDIDQNILGVIKLERRPSLSMAFNVKCETHESWSASNEQKNIDVLFSSKEEYIEPDEIKKEPIFKPEPYFNISETGQDNEQTGSKNFDEIKNKKLMASLSLSRKLGKRSEIETTTKHINLSSDIEEGEIVSDEENCIESQDTKYIIQGILDVVKHERIHSFPSVNNMKCETEEISSTFIKKENYSMIFPCKNEYIEPDDLIKGKPIDKV